MWPWHRSTIQAYFELTKVLTTRCMYSCVSLYPVAVLFVTLTALGHHSLRRSEPEAAKTIVYTEVLYQRTSQPRRISNILATRRYAVV